MPVSVQVSAFAGALVFIVLLITSAVAALASLLRALRRAPWTGPARVLGLLIALYGLLLGAIGLLNHDDVRLPVGSEKCFDDWCASARLLAEIPGDNASRVAVEIGLHNRARGAAFSGDHPRVQLIDGAGRLYEPIEMSGPLTARLGAGESATARAVFEVPRTARSLFLLVYEGPAFLCLVPGEERAPFHGRALLALSAASEGL